MHKATNVQQCSCSWEHIREPAPHQMEGKKGGKLRVNETEREMVEGA